MPFVAGEIPEGATPFEKGQSGNPAGYHKGVKNRSTIARKILEMKALFNVDTFQKLQDQFPEITKESTAEEIMTIIHLDKAITDRDPNSYKNIMDSAYGAPKQETELSGNVGIIWKETKTYNKPDIDNDPNDQTDRGA